MFLQQGALQLRLQVVPLAHLTRLLKPLPFLRKVRRLMVMPIPFPSREEGPRLQNRRLCGHDHPFPFPEEEGKLLRGRLCRDMATSPPFSRRGWILMTMATPVFCQKKEDVYGYDHPSLASRKGKRCLIMATPFFFPEEGGRL